MIKATYIKKQNGIALWEALISVILMAILGMGLVYALTRTAVAQKNMNAQNLLVSKVRSTIQQSNSGLSSLCPSSGTNSNTVSVGINNATVTKSCQMTTVSVTAAGITHTVIVPIIDYSIASNDLLGNGNTMKIRN
jgi:Tfp pilus assembly protein PilV